MRLPVATHYLKCTITPAFLSTSAEPRVLCCRKCELCSPPVCKMARTMLASLIFLVARGAYLALEGIKHPQALALSWRRQPLLTRVSWPALPLTPSWMPAILPVFSRHQSPCGQKLLVSAAPRALISPLVLKLRVITLLLPHGALQTPTRVGINPDRILAAGNINGVCSRFSWIRYLYRCRESMRHRWRRRWRRRRSNTHPDTNTNTNAEALNHCCVPTHGNITCR